VKLARTAAIVALVMVASVTCYAQDAANAPEKSLDIPVFTGGKVMADVSLSNQDFLPMLKESIKALGTKSTGPVPPQVKMLESLDLDSLDAALANLQAVRGLVYTLPSADSLGAIEEFYQSFASKQGWNRTVLLHPNENAAVNVFAKGTQGVFGFFVKKEGSGYTVMAGSTQGMLDIPKLIEWAKKAGGVFVLHRSEMMQPSAPTKVAPKTGKAPAKPAPKKGG